MSQYYPQSSSFYPPSRNPEDDYYDEDDVEYEIEEGEEDAGPGDTTGRRILIFLAGGLLVFLCMCCCLLVAAGLWFLDPGGGLLAATPLPGSDIGLAFDDPAFSDEAVINDQRVQLTILEVNRNASLIAVPQVEGRELIIVTVELVNLGEEEINYNERNFLLLNQFEEAYTPTSGVIEGSLNRGTLPPSEGLEGRLVFEVVAGEPQLILAWEGTDSAARYIELD